MISIKEEMLSTENIDLNKTFSRYKKDFLSTKSTIINRIRSTSLSKTISSNDNSVQQTVTEKTPSKPEQEQENNQKISGGEEVPKKNQFHCCKKNDTPEHLQRDYILNGYRVDFSHLLSLKSMFIPWHNDFSNIHTHFIPIFYFLYLFYDILISENSLSVYGIREWKQRISFGIFLCSVLLMLVNSTLYHTFGCHSLSVYGRLITCDYLGIISLIGSSFYPSLLFAFKGHPNLFLLYSSAITVLCLSLIVFVLVPRFQNSNKLRNSLFVLTALFAIFPTTHCFMLYPLHEISQYIYRIGGMFVLYGSGLGIYLAKIPECFFPGKFDYIITSHGIWHIFVVVAPLYHLQTCLTANLNLY